VQLPDPAVAGRPRPAIGPAKPPLAPWLLPVVAFLLPSVLAFAPKGTVAILVVLAVGGGIECLRLRRLPLPAPMVLAALALSLAWGALSVLWEQIPGLALHKAGQLTMLTLAGLGALAAVAPLSPRQRARVLPALVAGLVVVAALLVEERLTNLYLRRLVHAIQGKPLAVRPWVEMFMYKTSAAVSGVLATLAVGASFRRRWWLGVVLAAVAAIVMALLTKSLAGLVALGLGTAMVWGGRWGRRLLAVAVVAGFAVAPFAARLPDTATISQWVSLPNSALHRTIIWRFAASHVAEHPVLGWGLDAARELPGNDGMELLTTAEGTTFLQPVLPLHPHNMFVQVWLEAGAVGAVLAALLLLAVLRSAARLGNPGVAVMTAALLVSAVSFGAWQSWWLAVVWMLAAMACATATAAEA
jgi:O-antigen ligase